MLLCEIASTWQPMLCWTAHLRRGEVDVRRRNFRRVAAHARLRRRSWDSGFDAEGKARD